MFQLNANDRILAFKLKCGIKVNRQVPLKFQVNVKFKVWGII